MESMEEDNEKTSLRAKPGVPGGLLYTVEDTPPWYLCILLGFQHYLTAVGAMITVPLVLYEYLCMDEDKVGVSELISTIFFCSGISTLIQTTVGVRLPIVQGGTYAFVTPSIAILTQPDWPCRYREIRAAGGSEANFTAEGLPEIGSDEHRELWMMRIREIQGAIIVASVFQVLLGLTGIMGLALRYIGPLSIAPPVTLVGLSLFSDGAIMAANHTWIAITTVVLTVLFSQYLKNIQIPLPAISRKGKFSVTRLPLFTLFPVLLAVIVAWIICFILTSTGVFPSEPTEWGYEARTDINLDVMTKAKWFRFPYPGQWGLPTVSVSSVFGMLAAVLCGIAESLGDYYAGARISGAPPPPISAVNRGIAMEGIACILAGAWGSGNGTTSYSENIGAIGITKVGSRRVVQVGAAIMLVLGCFGKFGALFATIPSPIVGGMFMVTFGMVTAVGLSNLQFVDMNSSRNICIIGLSLSAGLCVPAWIKDDQNSINTGNDIVDQIISVLLGTSMFVGGVTGFVLDNTIPGTEDERGIVKWQTKSTLGLVGEGEEGGATARTYDIPYLQKYIDRVRLFRYLPFCPTERSGRGESGTGNKTWDYDGVKVDVENTRL